MRVYLYGRPVDIRKSFDGLYAIARAAYTQDPTAGDLYVFASRSAALIKVPAATMHGSFPPVGSTTSANAPRSTQR
ncbi:IS66 family insertion sequence element accessory protein TnpB [Polaromonas sp. P1-6]|nr:IS66 family insertion sequence element accessory protein TnpB [Polaromonas sp. P1-6]